MNSPYINTLLESEEIQFYIRNFGGVMKKNPTFEKYKNLSKEELDILYQEVVDKTSKLPRKDRDLITYFATKK